MLVDVKAFLLYYAVATQTVCIFDAEEDNHTYCECECSNYYSAESLYADGAFYTVSCCVAEDTCEDCAEDTAYAVNRYSTYRIVNLAHLIYKGNRETHHE